MTSNTAADLGAGRPHWNLPSPPALGESVSFESALAPEHVDKALLAATAAVAVAVAATEAASSGSRAFQLSRLDSSCGTIVASTSGSSSPSSCALRGGKKGRAREGEGRMREVAQL